MANNKAPTSQSLDFGFRQKPADACCAELRRQEVDGLENCRPGPYKLQVNDDASANQICYRL